MTYAQYKEYESKNGYDINLFSIEMLNIPYAELSAEDKKLIDIEFKNQEGINGN